MLEEIYSDWEGNVVRSTPTILKTKQIFRSNVEPVPEGFRPIYEARLDGVRGWVCQNDYAMHDIGLDHGGCCVLTKEQLEFYEKLEVPEGFTGLDRFKMTLEEIQALLEAPGTQMELFDGDTPGVAL